MKKYFQQSAEKQFIIAAITAIVILAIALAIIMFYPDLEDRSGWAQVAIELIAFPLATIGLYIAISEFAEKKRYRPNLKIGALNRAIDLSGPGVYQPIRGTPPCSYVALKSSSERKFTLNLTLWNRGPYEAKHIEIDFALTTPPHFIIENWEFPAHPVGGRFAGREEKTVQVKPTQPDFPFVQTEEHWTQSTGIEYRFTFYGGDNFICPGFDWVHLMTANCTFDNAPSGIIADLTLDATIRADNFMSSQQDKTIIAIAHRPPVYVVFGRRP